MQVGSSLPGIPNIATQLGQSNAPLAAFALAGGVTLAVGDVCMMFSVALLGLAVGPAAINAISIVVGAPPLPYSGFACQIWAVYHPQRFKAVARQGGLSHCPLEGIGFSCVSQRLEY